MTAADRHAKLVITAERHACGRQIALMLPLR